MPGLCLIASMLIQHNIHVCCAQSIHPRCDTDWQVPQCVLACKCKYLACRSRQEMAHAVHAVQSRVQTGSIEAQDVTDDTLREELYTQVCAPDDGKPSCTSPSSAHCGTATPIHNYASPRRLLVSSAASCCHAISLALWQYDVAIPHRTQELLSSRKR